MDEDENGRGPEWLTPGVRATDLLTPDHGHDRAATIAVGLYVGYNVAATLVSIPGGRQGDRRGMTRVFAVGVASIRARLQPLRGELAQPPLARRRIHCRRCGDRPRRDGRARAVATFAADGIRGSAFGFLAAVQSFGNLAASAVAGILYSVTSPSVAFGYAAVVMGVALAVVAATSRAVGAGS